MEILKAEIIPLFQILQFLGSGFGKEDYLGMPDTIRLQGKNLLVADSFIWA
jgi:hypothetical protein